MGISGPQYRYHFMRTDTSKGFRLLEIPETKGVPIRATVPEPALSYQYAHKRTDTKAKKPTVLNGYTRTDTVTSVPVPYAPEVQIWLPKAP
ncbi:hypothetical protein V6N13_092114 [Hibiscus sabdariffa]